MKMKKTVSLFLIALLLLSLSGCSLIDYKDAGELMKAGDYEAASSAYKALGDYKDSKIKAKACDYKIAKDLLNSGDYESAGVIFKQLDDYEDSEDWRKHCDYLAASAMFAAGDFNSAALAFDALGDFDDSAKMASRSRDKALADRLVGIWSTAPQDVTEYLVTYFADAAVFSNATLEEFFPFEEYYTAFLLTLSKDGTFTYAPDYMLYDETLDSFIDSAGKGLREYYITAAEQSFEEQGFSHEEAYDFLGVDDMDGVIEMFLGMSLEKRLDDLIPKASLIAMEEAKELSGTYTVSNGNLVLTVDDESFTVPYRKEESEILTYEDVEFYRVEYLLTSSNESSEG